MLNIKHESDIEFYKDIFADFWQSAVLRVSVIELTDDTIVPNGELIFSRDSAESNSEVLYQEGRFAIHEITRDSPFGLLKMIVEGEFPICDDDLKNSTKLISVSPAMFSGDRESHVKGRRPISEINGLVRIQLGDEIKEEFERTINNLDEELKRAKEPYYTVARCEEHYFEYASGLNNALPEILIFADTGIRATITDEAVLQVDYPSIVQDELMINVLPQKPYGVFKGWQINIEEEATEMTSDTCVRLIKEMGFSDMERVYILLFLADEQINHLEYWDTIGDKTNVRREIFDLYDADERLVQYLAGEDPDVFEIAVLNLLGTAGYFVQWFGDTNFVVPNWSDDVPGAQLNEVDIIAYHPDESYILFVECVNHGITGKADILDRVERIKARIGEEFVSIKPGFTTVRDCIPCIATPQTPNELNEEVISELAEKHIEILHRKRLHAMYEASIASSETVPFDTEYIEIM